MNINFLELSYLAILFAAVVRFAIGMAYYSPAVMGKCWMSCCETKPEEMCNKKCTLVGCFILGLIAAFVIAILFHLTGLHGWKDGACLGFWIWLGFVATTAFSGVLFSKMPLKLYGICTFEDFISYVVMGSIIGALS